MPDNTRILLARRPEGEPVPDDFRIVREPTSPPGDGQVLLKTLFLSLDPYMRGRMSAARSYAKPVEIGEVMTGEILAEVVESKSPDFRAGDIVRGMGGWQSYALMDAKGLRKIDRSAVPLTYWLGILGMPGLTAYCAVNDIGKPKAGETVVVSAASGAVGSVAGQIAKIKGCRVVGFAGSDDKCRYVVDTLGFDACINRRTQDVTRALQEACEGGVDFYFDNTGGEILDAVMRNLKLYARIAVVGRISAYNAKTPPPGPNLGPLLVNRALIQGFLVYDHWGHADVFERDMTAWLRDGKIHYKEDVVDGLDNAPRALIGLLRGDNFGKMLVKVS